MSPHSPSPAIDVQHLHLRYRNFGWKRNGPWHLENIHFQLQRGECLGIIGGNGNGKSTLLKACAGLLKPCRGKVSFPHRGQRPALLSLQAGFEMHLSAEDNAIMKGMLWGIPKSVILEQLDTIFKFAELEQDRHKRLATYSNGMMARLGFAIALHADSETYLFDEVFSVGDAVFRQKSSGLLLQKIEDGRSALFVSHHLELIKKFCHKVLWLEKGKQKMLGETQEVCAAYQAWVELQKKSSPH